MSDPIYLFPVRVARGKRPPVPNAVLDNDHPVEIRGYSLFTFVQWLRRDIDNLCVAVAHGKSHAVFYRYKIPNGELDKTMFRIQMFPEGRVVSVNEQVFAKWDEVDGAIHVKSGDWAAEVGRHRDIAALHHLGILPVLSRPVFEIADCASVWEGTLNEMYGTCGTLTASIRTIYVRLCMAVRFFRLERVIQCVSKNVTDYRFVTLVDALENDPDVERLGRMFPPTVGNKSPVFKVIKHLQFVATALDVTAMDVRTLEEALYVFQKKHDIDVGEWDWNVARKMAKTGFQQLPIFKIAGIKHDVNDTQHMCSKSIPLIPRESDDIIVQMVVEEINQMTIGLPDPVAKLAEMNAHVIRQIEMADKECSKTSDDMRVLGLRVDSMMTQLRDVMHESRTAVSRVETASRKLKGVYDAHDQIQGKFQILRDKLFREQKNTRLIMLIAIFLSLISAMRKFWTH